MFFEMKFDLGTLDSGERLLSFGLLVWIHAFELPKLINSLFFCFSNTVDVCAKEHSR